MGLSAFYGTPMADEESLNVIHKAVELCNGSKLMIDSKSISWILSTLLISLFSCRHVSDLAPLIRAYAD